MKQLHVFLPGLHALLGDLEPVLEVIGLDLEHQDRENAFISSGWMGFLKLLHLGGPDLVEIPPGPSSLFLLKQPVFDDHVDSKEVNPDIIDPLSLTVLVHSDGSEAAPDLVKLLVLIFVLLGYRLLDKYVLVFLLDRVPSLSELRLELEQVEHQLLAGEVHHHG